MMITSDLAQIVSHLIIGFTYSKTIAVTAEFAEIVLHSAVMCAGYFVGCLAVKKNENS